MRALTDAQLQAKTAAFRRRLAAGESLDELLPEAFAVVREAAWRVLRMRHYDVQLVGSLGFRLSWGLRVRETGFLMSFAAFATTTCSWFVFGPGWMCGVRVWVSGLIRRGEQGCWDVFFSLM